MSEQELLERKSAESTRGSKWIAGISSGQTVCEVASRVLDARLKAVCHALPLAAEKSEDDVEHVHRLRISVRRAVEAVRVFAALIPEVEMGSLRDRLRRIRRAADEARNWDVMTDRFHMAKASALPFSNKSETDAVNHRGRLWPSTRNSKRTPAERRSSNWYGRSNHAATDKESDDSGGKPHATWPRSSPSSSRRPSRSLRRTNRSTPCVASASDLTQFVESRMEADIST